jgi:pyroglutamyl-peptidase
MKRRRRAILLTGFERFGPFPTNPSADIVAALHAKRVAGLPIVGFVLPVSLGLAGGEAVIRLERLAVNLADFQLPDNDGTTIVARKLAPDGPDALLARLDLAACRARLLQAGIPARLSESAGTYLCNAAMYGLLRRVDGAVPCGFIHLPDTPAAVAARMRASKTGGEAAASMALATMIKAVLVVLRTALARPPASAA